MMSTGSLPRLPVSVQYESASFLLRMSHFVSVQCSPALKEALAVGNQCVTLHSHLSQAETQWQLLCTV